MSTRPPALRLLPVLLLGAGLLAGCGQGSNDALLEQARKLAAAGDHKAAIIQLKNALAQDENDAQARFELGKLYLDQFDLASAEKEFRRAREAGYAMDAVNPMLARTLIGQREYQRVLEELPIPADGGPAAAPLLALRAHAELGLARTEDARKTIARAQAAAPAHPDVQLALAQLALADNDVDKAMQALDAALKADPAHRDSLLLKGDVLRHTGNKAEARATYETALRADPRNIIARLSLANLAIEENRLADARQQVDAALKDKPNNLQARYTAALVDFRNQQPERARDRLVDVLKAAPDFLPALLLSGSVEYTLGNLQTAETHLGKVVSAAPNNPLALRLLAATQLRLGRVDDAARTLAPALRTAGQDPGVLAVAGEIALARKDYAQASSYFEQAVQHSPDSAALRTELGVARLAQGDSRAMADLQAAAGMAGDSSRADTVIILSQLRLQQFDAALASIDALDKKQPANPLTWNYRGAAYLGKKDVARARESFGQALKLNPAFFPAAANLAQLDLQDKQPDAARQRFAGILKADPKHLNAMLALADLALRQQDEKAFVGWLDKAAAAHPQVAQPRIVLARHQLGQGERSKALATAREAVNAEPGNPLALDVLGSIQAALGDTTNALATYRKVVELSQTQPAVPLTKLASVQIGARQYADARRTLEDALRAQPDLLDAQLLLARLHTQDARHDDALKIARKIQQQRPKSAAGLMLEGDIALARKQHAAALDAYERAYRIEPINVLLLRQLQTLTASQRAAEGEKRIANWLADHPKDTALRAALAESLLKRGQHKAATEQYLTLNTHSPNNLMVLNNLAWSLHEAGDKRALHYAEQALKLQPDNPPVMDTAGWIMVQQGQADRGLRLLQQALSKAPDSGEIHYHLAAAYAKAGDAARARSELERLLRSGVAFPQEPDARALLNQLQGATR